MLTFFRMRIPQRGSLAHRRVMARLRRWLAACCAAMAVYAVISAILSTVATIPVVVARTAIERGETITETDVEWADMPVSATSRLLVDSTASVVGRVAQIDIDAGQPFTTHMARDSPVTPTGHTVIEVRLSSDTERLIAGDTVTLVSATGCDASGANTSDTSTSDGNDVNDGIGVSDGIDTSARNDSSNRNNSATGSISESSDDSEAGGESGEENGLWEGACVLAKSAMAMGSPHADESSDATGRVVPFAMPPRDALRVMASQEAGAIVAVTRQSRHTVGPSALAVEHRPMRWQLAEDALVVIGGALPVGEHIARFEFDAVRVEQFGALPDHALMLARGPTFGRIRLALFGHGYLTSR